MSVWRASVRGTLAVTPQGRIEVINALCRAAFLSQLDPDGLAEALADLTSDFVSGHLRQADPCDPCRGVCPLRRVRRLRSACELPELRSGMKPLPNAQV